MADDVRGEGDRIALLLDEVRGMAGPSTWARVEELVQRIVRVYGAALGRVLELASDGGALDAGLAARLSADELVSSVLLLHGLHPVPPAERVARTVEALRERLRGDAAIELLTIGDDGVVRLRVEPGPDQRCGSSGAALGRAVEQAILEAAPEVTRIQLEGLGLVPSPAPERLVSLGRPRAGAGVNG